MLILFNGIPFNSYENIWVFTGCDCCIESTPLDDIPNVPAGEIWGGIPAKKIKESD